MKNSVNIKANQKGFTLIELVVVIVILGILAVTAAPKFIDLTGDAKASVVQAVQGSLSSAADMAYAKRLVLGVSEGGTTSIGNSTITFVNGYPDAETISDLIDINTDVSNPDFTIVEQATATTFTHAQAATAAECLVTYTEAEADEKPLIISTVTDC
ncbi:type II secretion system protein [Colwellia echini]|uniref:Prepilin-type N-terminal cleavage/methylation domain-containing protein n=1 Tax=Colwellia echini TaxID=1982103 RepID=A0ABY3N1N9_9GAMM|nr:prepilin-type N-terminal cleavage/methylation domain-containing protein [Colwellia echini]TYK67147.1 prepilin-type N-terminal cleavage/methylation domain-containing protein [Colwellia echini]